MNSELSKTGFIEYIKGDLPIIFLVPHGGYNTPDYLPIISDHVGDSKTIELTKNIGRYIKTQTNKYPFIIINKLKSNRLNANRSRIEATTKDGKYHNETRIAWDEFHFYINQSKEYITNKWGYGHVFDMHSNAIKGGYVQIGQRVTKTALNQGNNAIFELLSESSIRYMVETLNLDFIELTKGETSLGGLLEKRGIKSMPSPTYPFPNTSRYFRGGWNTIHHGSKDGGVISSTQIENYCNTIGFKDSRLKYGRLLADAILEFMQIHYNFNYINN